MASIKQRKSSFSVIYWYLDDTGERKQKWDTLETKKEAKQRKAFIEYYQEKFGFVLVPLEEQFAHQIADSKKDLEVVDKDITHDGKHPSFQILGMRKFLMIIQCLQYTILN